MSVAPGILNLTFPQGATWELSLTWTDAAGDAIDVTNYSARMQARNGYDGDAVLSLTSGSGITLGGTAGTIDLSVDAATTAAIGAAQYVYDLEVESSGGVVSRVVQGTLTVTREVTR